MSYNISSQPADGGKIQPKDQTFVGQGTVNVETPVIPNQSRDTVSTSADSAEGFQERQTREEIDDNYDNSSFGQGQEFTAQKPGLGQRMKGNLERATGQAIGDPGMVESGEMLKTGQSGSNF